MTRFAFGLVATVGVMCGVSAQDPADTPLKRAKVGDRVRYTRTNYGPPKDSKGTLELKVIDVADNVVVVEDTRTDNIGKSVGKVEYDLSRPWRPDNILHPFQDAKAVVEMTGREDVTIGPKTYKCDWKTLQINQSGKKKIDFKVKVWTADAVPLFGLVKAELNHNGTKLGWELVEFERK